MQIPARNAHVGVPCSVSDLGQRSSASQRMTDKRVPSVVDGQGFKASGAENSASGPETLAERMARERLNGAAWDQRRQERLVNLSILRAQPSSQLILCGG